MLKHYLAILDLLCYFCSCILARIIYTSDDNFVYVVEFGTYRALYYVHRVGKSVHICQSYLKKVPWVF